MTTSGQKSIAGSDTGLEDAGRATSAKVTSGSANHGISYFAQISDITLSTSRWAAQALFIVPFTKKPSRTSGRKNSSEKYICLTFSRLLLHMVLTALYSNMVHSFSLWLITISDYFLAIIERIEYRISLVFCSWLLFSWIQLFNSFTKENRTSNR